MIAIVRETHIQKPCGMEELRRVLLDVEAMQFEGASRDQLHAGLEPQLLVELTDDVVEIGGELGLIGELGLYSADRAVQDTLDAGGRITVSLSREHPQGKASHLLCSLGLADRLVPSCRGAKREIGAGGGSDEEHRDRACDRNEQLAIASGQLAGLVPDARRPCQDRLVAQVSFQVESQLPHCLVAILLVLLESFLDDRLEVAAEASIHGGERPGFLLCDEACRHRCVHAIQVVWQGPRQELVGDDADGVHVRACVDALGSPERLLGAHVWQGPHQTSDTRLSSGEVQVRVGHPRNAEVEDLGSVALVDQDVVRFQVAMHHPALVSVVKCIA